jgi:hypothetical protein
MSYTLGEAAIACGKSKSTISKAIKAGKISAEKNDHGTFEIEASELHRVYPPAPSPIEQNTIETQHLKIQAILKCYKPNLIWRMSVLKS